MKRLWTLILIACIARLIYIGFAEPIGERLPATPGMYTLGADQPIAVPDSSAVSLLGE